MDGSPEESRIALATSIWVDTSVLIETTPRCEVSNGLPAEGRYLVTEARTLKVVGSGIGAETVISAGCWTIMNIAGWGAVACGNE